MAPPLIHLRFLICIYRPPLMHLLFWGEHPVSSSLRPSHALHAYLNSIHPLCAASVTLLPLTSLSSPRVPNGNSIREKVLNPITFFCLHSKRFFLSSAARPVRTALAYRSFSSFDVLRSTRNCPRYRHDVQKWVVAVVGAMSVKRVLATLTYGMTTSL